MDTSPSRVSPLATWVFTLCQCLLGLASCCDADLCLLNGLGLYLLEMWWSSSCRGSSMPERGRELDSREGTIVTWDDGLVTFERSLRQVHVEQDASHVQAEAVQRDFSAQARASNSRSK
jgi:hypothetical protein